MLYYAARYLICKSHLIVKRTWYTNERRAHATSAPMRSNAIQCDVPPSAPCSASCVVVASTAAKRRHDGKPLSCCDPRLCRPLCRHGKTSQHERSADWRAAWLTCRRCVPSVRACCEMPRSDASIDSGNLLMTESNRVGGSVERLSYRRRQP